MERTVDFIEVFVKNSEIRAVTVLAGKALHMIGGTKAVQPFVLHDTVSSEHIDRSARIEVSVDV